MQKEILNNTQKVPNVNTVCINVRDDYSILLEEHKVEYLRGKLYLTIGNKPQDIKWLLHLSIVHPQIVEVFNLILPILKSNELSYGIIKDSGTARQILSGKMGYQNFAKVMTIFPATMEIADRVALELSAITSKYKGPTIPGTAPMGGCVYAQWVGKDVFIPEYWPFTIPMPLTVNIPAILKNRYRLYGRPVKENIKGNVYTAVYSTAFLRSKTCIVKEGKRYVWMDDHMRDITERLDWQRKVQSDLGHTVRVPEVIDFFKENNNTYLVMEYIKGMSLQEVLIKLQQETSWINLSSQVQLKLLSFLIKILDTVEKLHKSGFIHRDLTPANFLVDQKDHICLIDLELSYNFNDAFPSPAFRTGTKGFTSPEQEKSHIPTMWDDIYGLGGMMITFFTGLPPVKFPRDNKLQLIKALFLFIGDKRVAEIIANCFSFNPENRPSLRQIKLEIQEYDKQLSLSNNTPDCINRLNTNINAITIRQTIEETILSIPVFSMLNELSSTAYKDGKISFGYEKTMSLLFIFNQIQSQGITSEKIASHIDNFKGQLSNNISLQAIFSGLNGAARIALVMNYASRLGLLDSSSPEDNPLETYFETRASSIDIATGLAGQGLAILELESVFAKTDPHLLNSIVSSLLSLQLPGGAFPSVATDKGNSGIITGLLKGTAGVIFFLLNCYQRKPDEKIRQAVINGMNWLEKRNNDNSNGKYSCPANTLEPALKDRTLINGSIGIGIVFLKSYEVLKIPKHRMLAEKIIATMPAYPVMPDYSLATGICGMGVLFVLAARTLRNAEYLGRAIWIAGVLQTTYLKDKNGGGHWNMDGAEMEGYSLLAGNVGVLAFLILLHRELPQEL